MSKNVYCQHIYLACQHKKEAFSMLIVKRRRYLRVVISLKTLEKNSNCNFLACQHIMLQIDIIILHANIFIPHVDIFGGKITAQNREKYAIIHIRSN